MKLLIIILPLVSVMVFAEEYVYSPGDSEQFIFPIRSEFLQNYGYACIVPYIREGNVRYLKTIYRSRKAKRLFTANKHE